MTFLYAILAFAVLSLSWIVWELRHSMKEFESSKMNKSGSTPDKQD